MPLRPAVRALVLLPLAVLALGSCSSEPSADERRDDLVRGLAEDLQQETDGALDDAAATCVAAQLVDVVGPDAFEDVVAEARDGGDDELRRQVVDAFGSCDALEPLLEG